MALAGFWRKLRAGCGGTIPAPTPGDIDVSEAEARETMEALMDVEAMKETRATKETKAAKDWLTASSVSHPTACAAWNRRLQRQKKLRMSRIPPQLRLAYKCRK